MEITKELQALIKKQAEGSDRVSKEIIIKIKMILKKLQNYF